MLVHDKLSNTSCSVRCKVRLGRSATNTRLKAYLCCVCLICLLSMVVAEPEPKCHCESLTDSVTVRPIKQQRSLIAM